jgi:hypothetical protein
MKQLPPNKYIVDDRYLPNYNQTPYDICHITAILSEISVELSKKYYCNETSNNLSSSSSSAIDDTVYACGFAEDKLDGKFTAVQETYWNDEKLYIPNTPFIIFYIFKSKNTNKWSIGDDYREEYSKPLYESDSESVANSIWRVVNEGRFPEGITSFTNCLPVQDSSSSSIGSSSSSMDNYKGIQLSLWKFINCYEKYITTPDFVGENFIQGKKCDIGIRYFGDTADSLYFEDVVVIPSRTAYFNSNHTRYVVDEDDKQIFLQEILSTNKQTLKLKSIGNIITDNVYSTLPTIYNSDDKDYFLNKNYYSKRKTPPHFSLCYVTAYNITPINISFKDYIEKHCKLKLDIYNIGNKFISIKEILDDLRKDYLNGKNAFQFNFARIVESILYDANAPFNIVCNKFDDNTKPEMKNTFISSSTTCFESNDCTVQIELSYFDNPKFAPEIHGKHKLKNSIDSLDSLKAVLYATQKPVHFSISPFLIKVLTVANALYENKLKNSSKAFEDLNTSLRPLVERSQQAELCMNERRYYAGLADCVNTIFIPMLKDDSSKIKNTNTIDISTIDYFNGAGSSNFAGFESTYPLYAQCEKDYDCGTKSICKFGIVSPTTNQLVNSVSDPGDSHAIIVYGYETNLDNTITLYCKNSWAETLVDSNASLIDSKFKLIVNFNVMIGAWDEPALGRLGCFEYIKNEDIKFVINKPNLCDCCSDLSSSSSASGSSSSSGGSSSSSMPPEPGQIYACYFDVADDINGEFNAIDILNSSNVYTNNSNRIIYKNGLNQWVIAVWDFGYEGDILYQSPIGSSVITSNWTVVYGNGEGGQTLESPCL